MSNPATWPRTSINRAVAPSGTGGFILGGYQGNGSLSADAFGHLNWIIPSATEANEQDPAPIATTYQNLHANVTASTGAVSTFRMRIAGVNGNLAVTLTAATTGVFSDTSNSDTVSQADLVGLMWDEGSTATVTIKSTGIEDTGNATYGGGYNANTLLGADQFYSLNSSLPSTDETKNKTPTPATMTLANAHCNVFNNGRNGESQHRIRIAGVNGNTAIAIPATTSGVFGDTSNSDAITQADQINYMIDVGGSSGNIAIKGAMIERSV